MDGKLGTFRYLPKKHRLIPIGDNPAITELATAYYQTASELFKSHRYQ